MCFLCTQPGDDPHDEIGFCDTQRCSRAQPVRRGGRGRQLDAVWNDHLPGGPAQPLADPFLAVEISALTRRQQHERVGERERIDRPPGQHALTDRCQVHVVCRNEVHRHPGQPRGDTPECQRGTVMVCHQDGIGARGAK